jgi:sec-independent protein translocase protein TatA
VSFFGIGPGELLLILALALIVFGPRKLPEIMREVGKAVVEFRRASEQITREVARDLAVEAAEEEERKKLAGHSPNGEVDSAPNASQDRPT